MTSGRRAGESTIGEIVVYAVGVRISPAPVAASIVVLTGRHAIANGAFFLVGWALGVFSGATLFVVLVDRVGISDAASEQSRGWTQTP